jgi:hypothetical protein
MIAAIIHTINITIAKHRVIGTVIAFPWCVMDHDDLPLNRVLELKFRAIHALDQVIVDK